MNSKCKTIESTIVHVFFKLANSYPSAYRNQSENELKSQSQCWKQYFKNHDYDLLLSAVDSYIRTDTTGFPPNIGKIMKKMFQIKFDLPTFYDIWEMFRMCSALPYSKQKCWENMPSIFKSIVSLQDVNDYSYMESNNLRDKFRDKLETRYSKCLQTLFEGFTIAGSEYKLGLDNTLLSDSKCCPKCLQHDVMGLEADELLPQTSHLSQGATYSFDLIKSNVTL